MASRHNERLECKVYVGNLGTRPPRKEDIEYEFKYYGKIRSVWVARSPPGFAYVEFEDERDARDAIKGLDGKKIRWSKNEGRIRSAKTRRTKITQSLSW